MNKFGVLSFSQVMETDESVEIADLQVRFNTYGSEIHADSDDEVEIAEDRSRKVTDR